MPSAYAVTIDTSTASTATEPAITVLLNSFSPKSTRTQKSTMPLRYTESGRPSGPFAV